eukprot:TRINITY_DN2852_c0_g1_i1.p1 TRINITY_DN2852_c0_g1~~TRINITY_DN2852_c0_g1_i1.p1  ORF type:complete len:835 (+),score=218.18 TRINITY_DN2852_c0_g1_i1:105-2609(+)
MKQMMGYNNKNRRTEWNTERIIKVGSVLAIFALVWVFIKFTTYDAVQVKESIEAKLTNSFDIDQRDLTQLKFGTFEDEEKIIDFGEFNVDDPIVVSFWFKLSMQSKAKSVSLLKMGMIDNCLSGYQLGLMHDEVVLKWATSHLGLCDSLSFSLNNATIWNHIGFNLKTDSTFIEMFHNGQLVAAKLARNRVYLDAKYATVTSQFIGSIGRLAFFNDPIHVSSSKSLTADLSLKNKNKKLLRYYCFKDFDPSQADISDCLVEHPEKSKAKTKTKTKKSSNTSKKNSSMSLSNSHSNEDKKAASKEHDSKPVSDKHDSKPVSDKRDSKPASDKHDSKPTSDKRDSSDLSVQQSLIPSDTKALAAGTDKMVPTSAQLALSNELGRKRRVKVKEAMKHAWGNYEKLAFGKDELKPISGQGNNYWGMSVQIIDALDTLWVMGMKEEFKRCETLVSGINFKSKHVTVSTFESNIRIVGGLLAAYNLSGNKMFANKAQDVADVLMKAFNPSTGIPTNEVRFPSSGNPAGHSQSIFLSEMGTMQVEFRYLTYITGDRKYADIVEKGIRTLRKFNNGGKDGLYAVSISTGTGFAGGPQITLGARGDSFYEYLFKMWMQGGRKEKEWIDMFHDSMAGVHKHLWFTSEDGLGYVADLKNGQVDHKMDHLVCFLAGTLAEASKFATFNLRSEKREYLRKAKALAYTCWQSYERTPSGLGPEYSTFINGGKTWSYTGGRSSTRYLLRPETAEALFFLHEVTGHPMYREWAWAIFEAIETNCRTKFGYAAINNVGSEPGKAPKDDYMDSYFMAETMKYLYLIQDPDHEVDIEKSVFNTEAHILPVLDG